MTILFAFVCIISMAVTFTSCSKSEVAKKVDEMKKEIPFCFYGMDVKDMEVSGDNVVITLTQSALSNSDEGAELDMLFAMASESETKTVLQKALESTENSNMHELQELCVKEQKGIKFIWDSKYDGDTKKDLCEIKAGELEL